MSSSRPVPNAADDDEGDPVPPALLASIRRGIADAEAGRTVSGEQALKEFRALVTRLRADRDRG